MIGVINIHIKLSYRESAHIVSFIPFDEPTIDWENGKQAKAWRSASSAKKHG
jgi:hypothetical protein